MIQIEPLTKRLEFEPRAKRLEAADFKQVSSALDDEATIWHRLHWRLLEEQFLFWYLWLRDHFEEMKEFVQELKSAVGEISDDNEQVRP